MNEIEPVQYNPANLQYQPNEIKFKICEYLKFPDLNRLSRTCREWRVVTRGYLTHRTLTQLNKALGNYNNYDDVKVAIFFAKFAENYSNLSLSGFDCFYKWFEAIAKHHIRIGEELTLPSDYDWLDIGIDTAQVLFQEGLYLDVIQIGNSTCLRDTPLRIFIWKSICDHFKFTIQDPTILKYKSCALKEMALDILKKTQSVKKAQLLVDEIPLIHYKDPPLAAIAKKLANEQKYKEAFDIAFSIRDELLCETTIDKICGIIPDNFELLSFVNSLCRDKEQKSLILSLWAKKRAEQKDLVNAYKFLNVISIPIHKDRVLAAIARCQAGRKLYQETLHTINQIQCNAVKNGAVANFLKELNGWWNQRPLYERLYYTFAAPASTDKSEVYKSIAKSFLRNRILPLLYLSYYAFQALLSLLQTHPAYTDRIFQIQKMLFLLNTLECMLQMSLRIKDHPNNTKIGNLFGKAFLAILLSIPLFNLTEFIHKGVICFSAPIDPSIFNRPPGAPLQLVNSTVNWGCPPPWLSCIQTPLLFRALLSAFDAHYGKATKLNHALTACNMLTYSLPYNLRWIAFQQSWESPLKYVEKNGGTLVKNIKYINPIQHLKIETLYLVPENVYSKKENLEKLATEISNFMLHILDGSSWKRSFHLNAQSGKYIYDYRVSLNASHIKTTVFSGYIHLSKITGIIKDVFQMSNIGTAHNEITFL